MASAREYCFKVNDLEIAARIWGPEDGIPVIAIHGWLDNCASFDAIAPLLTGCRIVALDLAGHGQSSHRSAHGSYNIWDDCIDILAIADELGWDQFNLLAHSRGALVALLLSASIPDRFTNIVLLDGIFTPPSDPQEAAKQLGEYIVDQRKYQQVAPRVHKSIKAAIELRCKKNSLSKEDCEPLVRRGMRKLTTAIDDKEGYIWRHDSRAQGASAFKLTGEHHKSFLNALKTPCFLLVAEHGLSAWIDMIESVKQYDIIDVLRHAGGHHMHMESSQVLSLSKLISNRLGLK